MGESAVAEAQATLAAQADALVTSAADSLPEASPVEVAAIQAELWTLTEKQAALSRLESLEQELESWRAHQTAQQEMAAAQASISPMPSASSSESLPTASPVATMEEAGPAPVEITLAAPVADSSPEPVKKRRLGRVMRRR
jgi:hypothetical protein